MGANPRSKDESGFTALHWAARFGKAEALAVILRHPKADPNDTDNSGWTALHYAASGGHKDACMVSLICS